jgi:hypothetical protein
MYIDSQNRSLFFDRFSRGVQVVKIHQSKCALFMSIKRTFMTLQDMRRDLGSERNITSGRPTDSTQEIENSERTL